MTEDANWFGPEVATFGDRLAAAREQAGLSQAELAKRLGVRQSTLRGWEDDHAEPRANRLSMLAGLLNVSMMWLINAEGEGLKGPVEENDTSDDELRALLTEMRALRMKLQTNAEDMGRLEKRMRRIVEGALGD